MGWLFRRAPLCRTASSEVSKLFNKTGNMLQLRDLPADEPRLYTVTLYDPKTLDPVDIEANELILALLLFVIP